MDTNALSDSQVRYIIRHSQSDYPAICDFLIENLGFTDVHRVKKDRSIKGKWSLLLDFLGDCAFVCRTLGRLRQADNILCVGYIAIPVVVLRRLGIIRAARISWFSFFIHSPRWFPIFRMAVHLASHDSVKYLVFSRSETHLYHRVLRIPRERLLHVPYGSWGVDSGVATGEPEPQLGEYYFAGGASNRDYTSLIDAFREMDACLIVVCSAIKNRDATDATLPPNVQVYTDLPSEQFDRYIAGAKACLLLLKYDTGASGQSVLLRYMRYGKAIVASDTSIVREYLEDGISGILVSDPVRQLPSVISDIDSSPQKRRALGERARECHEAQFSRRVVARALARAAIGEKAAC